jgi:uncharacterized caspase-like protein
VNYLIPVDARLVTDFDVEDETVPLDRVLQAMEPAKRLRLVLLDACRENPFLKSMKRTVAARSVGRGLGRIEPSTTNTLIAFATKPNAIAEDGRGPNSPFTAALVRYLLTPGLDLRIALGHVRDEVLKATGSKQEPYVTGSLGGGTVMITGGPFEPAAVPQPLLSETERAWAAVRDSTSITALEAFRRQYGASNAFYDQLAEARIEELKRQHIATLKTERDRELAEEEKRRAEAAARKRPAEEEQEHLFGQFLEWSKRQKLAEEEKKPSEASTRKRPTEEEQQRLFDQFLEWSKRQGNKR